MSVLLGVLVAMSFGSGDYAGGRASMRAPTAAVVVVSQTVAVVLAIFATIFVSAEVAPHDITYGLLAGCFNVIGLALLYRGLATAAMGVVAPVTAVCSASVPVTWGLLHGERPATLALVGILLAIGAAALIGFEPRAADENGRLAPGILIAVGAGVTLGSSLVFYSEASDASGMWPVFAGRLSAFVIAAAAWFVVFRRKGERLPSRGAPRNLSVAAGVFDVTATVLLIVAVRRGLISVVAGLSALSPGFTAVLAWIVLREHVTTRQRVGLAIALVGLVLVATG
jgi:drug/metabolite transporter (DMT)-like permease